MDLPTHDVRDTGQQLHGMPPHQHLRMIYDLSVCGVRLKTAANCSLYTHMAFFREGPPFVGAVFYCKHAFIRVGDSEAGEIRGSFESRDYCVMLI